MSALRNPSLFRLFCLVSVACGFGPPAVQAADEDVRILNQLRTIQAEYWQPLVYPAALSRQKPAAEQFWERLERKQSQVAKLSTAGLAPELRGLLTQASEQNRLVLSALKPAIEKLRKLQDDKLEGAGQAGLNSVNPLNSKADRQDAEAEVFADLGIAVMLELVLEKLQKEMKAGEQKFSENWNRTLNTLARARPQLQEFADDPSACSPVIGIVMPDGRFPAGQIGMSAAEPYEVGELTQPVEFKVEPTGPGSWRYFYHFSCSERSWFNARIRTDRGFAQSYLLMRTSTGMRHSSEKVFLTPQMTGQLRFPVSRGDYYLVVYHSARAGFGTSWSGTEANLQLWLGDSEQPPARFQPISINPVQQAQRRAELELAARKAREKLFEQVPLLLQQKPVFTGVMRQDQYLFPFQLALEFSPTSKTVKGTIEWPSLKGATQFRGQLVNTNQGWELSFRETDFVKGRESKSLVLGSTITLQPAWYKDQIVFTGTCQFKGQTHPIRMQLEGTPDIPAAGWEPLLASQPVAVNPRRPGMTVAAAQQPRPSAPVPTVRQPAAAAEDPEPNAAAEPATDAELEALLPVIAKRPKPALKHLVGEIHNFTGATSYNGVSGVAFSRDGKLGYGCGDKLTVWDLTKRTKAAELDVTCKQVKISDNGTTMAFIGSTGSASQAIFLSSNRKGAVPTHLGELDRLSSLALSPNGKVVAAGGEQLHHVFLYDAVKRQVLPTSPIVVDAELSAMCFTPDGKLLLTADDMNGVRIWDVGQGAFVGRFTGHGKQSVRSLLVSPDGKHVVSGSIPVAGGGPMLTLIWDIEKLEERHSVSLGDRATTLAVSPDWRWALVGEETGALLLCNLLTGEVAHEFSGHKDGITSLTFSACWSFALTGAKDDTVRLWGLPTLSE